VTRYEGARFSDGSVAVRRISEDPCERHTLTFESWVECRNELGRDDEIAWVGRGVKVLFPDMPPGYVPIVGDDKLIGFTMGGEDRAGVLASMRAPIMGTHGQVIGHASPLDINRYVAGGGYEPTEETDEP
jgi:hypothetical protein